MPPTGEGPGLSRTGVSLRAVLIAAGIPPPFLPKPQASVYLYTYSATIMCPLFSLLGMCSRDAMVKFLVGKFVSCFSYVELEWVAGNASLCYCIVVYLKLAWGSFGVDVALPSI